MTTTTKRLLGAGCLAAALAAGLSACGGGDGAGATVQPAAPVSASDVPSSATTSSQGALAFVVAVGADRPDSAEPLNLGDAVLASSDSDEPADL